MDAGRHFLFEAEHQARIAAIGADPDLAFDPLCGQRAAAERPRPSISNCRSATIASAPPNSGRPRRRLRARAVIGLWGIAVMQPFQPATMPAATA